MTPEEYKSLSAVYRSARWTTLTPAEQQAIIESEVREKLPLGIRERAPLDGLGVHYPYAVPGIVTALRVIAVAGLILSVIIGFLLTFSAALIVLGAVGSVALWSVTLDYLARSAHYSHVSAALLWASSRKTHP